MSNNAESSTAALHGGGESRKRKRRKVDKLVDVRTKWRSDSDQQTYSTKLLDALRFVQYSPSDPHNIRAAADRVLAATAKGRTRWSRAILKSRRLRSKIFKKVTKRNPNDKLGIVATSSSRIVESRRPEKRAAVLGRLVPGCGKLSFSSLLEETTDYIAALEMQIRAMATLARLLTFDA